MALSIASDAHGIVTEGFLEIEESGSGVGGKEILRGVNRNPIAVDVEGLAAVGMKAIDKIFVCAIGGIEIGVIDEEAAVGQLDNGGPVAVLIG